MKRLALATALSLVGGLAQANLVQNGSFELTNATTTSAIDVGGIVLNNWSHTPAFPNITGEAIVLPSWFTNGYLTVPTVTFDGPVTQSSPDGGNFVFSDADFMNTPITQIITGLTPSATYQLSFWQALAQDKEPNVTIPGFVTGYWQATLGSTTFNSTLMKANGSIAGPGSATWSPWALETMVFTAQNATEVLSFLSVGTGDPPLALIDGVSLTEVPVPGAFWLFSSAGLALGGLYRRTRWQQLTGQNSGQNAAQS
jgi:hypothetical protein